MNRVSVYFKLLTAVCMVGLSFFYTEYVSASEKESTLILYGGFGHLSNSAQPIFTQLMTAKQGETVALRHKMLAGIEDQVSARKLPLSSHPVALEAEDVKKIISEIYEEQPEDFDFEDLTAVFEKVYLIVFAASHEQHVSIKRSDKDFDDYMIVSTTAMLVEMSGDLGENQVLLSATEDDQARVESSQKLSEREKTRISAILYRKTAENALQKLFNRIDTYKPVRSEERGMVTGVYVHDQGLRTLFDVSEPQQKKITSCKLASACEDGSPHCNAMMGYIASTMTEKLIEEGLTMLPSLAWSQWGHLASENTAVTLQLPRGNELIEDTLKINVSPRSAEKKYSVVISRSVEDDQMAPGTDKWIHRYHVTEGFWCRYETDLEGNVLRATQTRGKKFKNDKYYKISEPVATYGEKTSEERTQGYKLISIFNAIKAYGK